MPVAEFVRQMIGEVKPKLVITVGTAGATRSRPRAGRRDHHAERAFRCTQEFRNEPFADTEYHSTVTIRRKHQSKAKR